MCKVSWSTLSCYFGLIIVSLNLISNCESSELNGKEADDREATTSRKYSTLVIIGDSYSDDGHPRPPEFQKTLASPPSFGGRYSDGLVWDEFLAHNLSVESNVTLLNYAYNGAHIDNELSNLTYALPPDTEAQVETYLDDISEKIEESPTELTDGRILHIFWIGINPLVSTWRTALSENKTHDDRTLLAPELVAKLDQQVGELGKQLNQLLNNSTLSKLETDYVLMTIPPLNGTQLIRDAASAAAIANPTLTQKNLKLYSDMTDHFNLKLTDTVTEIKSNIRDLAYKRRIAVFDTVKVWEKVESTPSKFGFDSAGTCRTDAHQCTTPDRYLYWDVLHPSSHMHLILSNEILKFLDDFTQ